MRTRCGKIGDTGEDVGEPGLRIEQRAEATVAVGLQDAGEPGQMLLRVLATSVA